MNFNEPFSILYRRQEELDDRIPTSFIPLIASANGNCLYNAISILLFGDEEQAVLLRLASVEYAIGHFMHYMEMVSIIIISK